ncbi:MAG: DNA translocase FtsK 4TM domain-containing protein, partial [Muribaculaceae bacterium]|nr:DNA translocase FtsK 4TM domain-containing protein [Muribaculaceae bacterium]
MKQYHNYSPEISTAEETAEPVVVSETTHNEPAQGRRRRNSRHKREDVANVNSIDVGQKSDLAVSVASTKKTSDSFLTLIREWKNSVVTRSVLGIILGGLGFWFAVAFASYLSACIADQSMVGSEMSGPDIAVSNDAGEGGARLTELLINQGFGVGAIVIVVWLLCMSLKLLIGYPKFRTLDFTIKSLIAFITLSVVIGMVSIGLDTDINWGGFHGRYINEIIYSYIGWSGAIIISVVLISIFVVICLRDAIKWILDKKRRYDERRRQQLEAEEAELKKQEELKERERQSDLAQSIYAENEEIEEERQDISALENVEFNPDADTIFDMPDLEDDEEPVSRFDSVSDDPNSLAITEDQIDDAAYNFDLNEKSEDSNVKEQPIDCTYSEKEYSDAMVSQIEDVKEKPIEEEGKNSTPCEDIDQDSVRDNKAAEEVKPEDEMTVRSGDDIDQEARSGNIVTEEAKPDDVMTVRSGDDIDREAVRGNEAVEEAMPEDVMTVNVNQIEKSSHNSGKSYAENFFTHEYHFPPSEYLLPGAEKISVDADELLENKEKIRQTLLDFGIPITSIEATVGPTVTLYEIRPDTGVKIAKIRGLADDLALSLAANGVRIIAPIPGKGTVGIEVANKEAQTVSMRTIIQSKVYQNTRYKLPVALGSTISNEVYIADLAKMPHLLVAGATGQGKSVGLNAIVTSLLYSKRPEELKFVMVDPKRVEFTLYTKIEKYYLAKIPDSPQAVITKMENVVATLNSLCVEMDERYMLLEKAYVKQLTEYNEKFNAKKLDPREGHRYMPYIVVIIDEFADLIMTAGKDVELPIARLAQLARAVGIHVIIATQRPSTNVITGMIKANFPVRIAFKVSS